MITAKDIGSAGPAVIYVIGAGCSGAMKFPLFRRAVEEGSLVLKETTIKNFIGADELMFSDCTSAKIDTLMLCTGYKKSYPFLKSPVEKNQALLIEYECEGRYIGPLYKRMFCKLNSLCFILTIHSIVCRP